MIVLDYSRHAPGQAPVRVTVTASRDLDDATVGDIRRAVLAILDGHHRRHLPPPVTFPAVPMELRELKRLV